MTREIDNYYMKQQEPVRSCMLALREIVLRYHPDFSEAWKYGMPFFCIHGRMFCYLWIHKKTGMPYIGVVEGKKISHPKLVQEKRARMKIFFIDPDKDIPVKTVNEIFKKAMVFYPKK